MAVLPKIINGSEKFLMYLAPNGTIFEGQFKLIGGKINSDEEYTEAIKKEFMEEFGMKVNFERLLYTKSSIYGKNLYLVECSSRGTPTRMEKQVGNPVWKTAEELFFYNLTHDSKVGLYTYLREHDSDDLNRLVKRNNFSKDFLDFLHREANDLYLDLVARKRS